MKVEKEFEEVLLGEYKEDKEAKLLARYAGAAGERRTIRNREKITGSKTGIGMLAIHTVWMKSISMPVLWSYNYRSSFKSPSLIHPAFRQSAPKNRVKTAGSTKQMSRMPGHIIEFPLPCMAV